MNVTEKKLKWYGHVKRREERHVVRRLVGAPEGLRTRKETDRKTENQVERLVQM